jgi:hypothetical protein
MEHKVNSEANFAINWTTTLRQASNDMLLSCSRFRFASSFMTGCHHGCFIRTLIPWQVSTIATHLNVERFFNFFKIRECKPAMLLNSKHYTLE